MPRKGENIYKRKDGRWEGRYIKSRTPAGKANYGYVYRQAGIVIISDEFVLDTSSFVCNKSLHSDFSFCFL